MTFRVFISSSIEDIHTVNELRKTLERYGIQSIVPDVEGYRGTHYIGGEIRPLGAIVDEIKQRIQASDCVLAIIGKGGSQSENVDSEIGIARGLGKLIIPVVEEGCEIPQNLANRGYILMDKNRPRLSYERAAQYLNTLRIEEERRNAIGGLLLLGLGLLLLAALASGD